MRCGYSDELGQREFAMYRGRVRSAISGKRGQNLLRGMLAALDAMPEKRLISGVFANADGVCALGARARYLGWEDIEKIDSEEHGKLASRFDVAECLIREIEYINDNYYAVPVTEEKRFNRVRQWIVENLRDGGKAL